MRFNFYGDQIDMKFESRLGDPWESWLRLKYAIADYWSGEEVEIDDQIYLAASCPHFGGLRWFVCPYLNRRARKLYVPLGGRHFWSRRAYELAYASQRETKFEKGFPAHWQTHSSPTSSRIRRKPIVAKTSEASLTFSTPHPLMINCTTSLPTWRAL